MKLLTEAEHLALQSFCDDGSGITLQRWRARYRALDPNGTTDNRNARFRRARQTILVSGIIFCGDDGLFHAQRSPRDQG